METSLHNANEHPLNAGFAPQGGPTMGTYGRTSQLGAMDARQVIAIALIVLGMIGVIVAWFGISGTLDPGKQMPYLASGGIGGVALIAIGVTVYISWEHVQDRATLAVLLQRLDEVESALRDAVIAGERPDEPASAANGPTKRTKAIRARS